MPTAIPALIVTVDSGPTESTTLIAIRGPIPKRLGGKRIRRLASTAHTVRTGVLPSIDSSNTSAATGAATAAPSSKEEPTASSTARLVRALHVLECTKRNLTRDPRLQRRLCIYTHLFLFFFTPVATHAAGTTSMLLYVQSNGTMPTTNHDELNVKPTSPKFQILARQALRVLL